MSEYLDKILGSLIGGAAGDALGYPIEFQSYEQICHQYGPEGMTEYALDRRDVALFSDDTQMTLFTANGILVGATRAATRGISGPVHIYIARAYQDWLNTQSSYFRKGYEMERCSWLCDVPELYAARAPGNTCLSALEANRETGRCEVRLDQPCNHSKGCGGIMRVAPLALYKFRKSLEKLTEEGALCAAITHGHPLGYMPAGVLVDIVHQLVYNGTQLRRAISNALEVAKRVFRGEKELPVMAALVRRAMELAENRESDIDNIRALGEGWVAEETLAIAVYCALRHEDDFSAALVAAVTHDGDSDSTGAVTGNILGALHGYGALDEKWKEHLELREVIEEMGRDLDQGCPLDDWDYDSDPDWERKYIRMHWKAENES